MLIAGVASVICVMTQVQSVMAQQAPSITIDGRFSDWERVPSAYLVEDTVDERSNYEYLYRVRFCTDVDYIYFYAEFNNDIAQNPTGQAEGDTTTHYNVKVVDLFMDTDNSARTGYQMWTWEECGADYILEGRPREDYGELSSFAGGEKQEEWEWEQIESSGMIGASGITVLANGHAAIEGFVARGILSIPDGAESIKVGVLTQSSDWQETGVLPEVRIDDKEGTTVKRNLLDVPLYVCEGMTWGLNDMMTAHLECDGNLFLWGEGEMPDYAFGKYAPWHDKDYVEQVLHLYLDSAITTVGSYAFYDCSYMQSAELSNHLTTISWNAFYGCTSLKSITIPASVTTIDNNAFGNCSGLEEMICMATTPPDLGNTVFLGMSSNAPLYVPSESVDAYKRNGEWEQYPGQILSIEERKEPSIVVIGGDTVMVDPTTSVVDINGDGTLVYDVEENTLTLTGLETSGMVDGTAINYSGSEPLTIVLNGESSITAEMVIASTGDVIITGEGTLTAEGVLPIVGVETATITFDAVRMVVRSMSASAGAIRRLRGLKFGKYVDENGGPALSGFGSADFGKVDITPSDAAYGPVSDGEGGSINALYTENNGEREIVTEFETTPKETAVENVQTEKMLDVTKPMYNVLGVQVNASYEGIVIQQGQKFVR